MNEKHTVKVKIFGSEYNITGEAAPAHIEALARLVDEKMRELGQPGSIQNAKIAIMAAFNLADELTKTRKALEAEHQRYDQAARQAAAIDLDLQKILEPAPAPQPTPTLLAFEAADAIPAPPPPAGQNPPEDGELPGV